MWNGNTGHFWGLHWIWWLCVIILVAWLFTKPWKNPGKNEKRDTPLDVLKEKFARGEISKEEYEEKAKDLQQH